MKVDGIGGLGARLESIGLEKAKPSDSKGFGDVLASGVAEVDRLQKDADNAVYGMALGKGEDIHKVMIAIEKADVSFQFMLAVRNKAINAYEEIMRMPV